MRAGGTWLVQVLATVATVLASAPPAHGVAPNTLLSRLSAYHIAHVHLTGHSSPLLSDSYPDAATLTFDAFSRNFSLELRRNQQLFAPDYREVRREVDAEGNLVRETVSSGLQAQHCFYHGTVHVDGQREGDSVVALNTCHGGGAVRGTFHSQGEVYGIDSAVHPDHLRAGNYQTSTVKHVIFNVKHKITAGEGESDPLVRHRCANHPTPPSSTTTEEHADTPRGTRSSSRGSPSSSVDDPLQAVGARRRLANTDLLNELVVVNDHARYQVNKENTELATAEIVNAVSAIFNKAPLVSKVQIALTAQLTWVRNDGLTLTPGMCGRCKADEVSSKELLNKFEEWIEDPDNIGYFYDNVILLTGRDLDGDNVGIANQGVICKSKALGQPAAIVQGTFDLLENVKIMAHEIGHNFNMVHDDEHADGGDREDCPCGYLMAAESGGLCDGAKDRANLFSPCSADDFEFYLASLGSNHCLMKASTSIRWADGRCGNGFVEEGEECDCFEGDCGTDACCDPSTCLLLPGANCSDAEPCCEGCSVVPASDSTVCRPAASLCDFAEVCDGNSTSCPLDVYQGAGQPCKDDKGKPGRCFQSKCHSATSQCAALPKLDAESEELEACALPGSFEKQIPELCAVLLCKTVGSTVVGQCQQFSQGAESVVVAMEDGNSCQRTGVPVQSTLICSGGICTDALEIPSNHHLNLTDWSACSACFDGPQRRSGTCVETATGITVDSSLCPPAILTRECTTRDLECDSPVTGGFEVLGFYVKWIWVLIAGLALGALLLVCCIWVSCCRLRSRVAAR